jgi:mono/diheme cytochrome c family protein
MRNGGAVLAALLLATVATAQAGEKEDWGRIGAGRAFFISNCVPCHGPFAQGTGEGTDGLASERLNLTRIKERSGGQFDEVRVYQVVYGANDVPAGGHREMPVWGRVIARQRSRGEGWAHTQCASLVAYPKYIQEHPPVPPVAARE